MVPTHIPNRALFPCAAITESHRLSGFIDKQLLSHSSGGWWSQNKVSTEPSEPVRFPSEPVRDNPFQTSHWLLAAGHLWGSLAVEAS